MLQTAIAARVPGVELSYRFEQKGLKWNSSMRIGWFELELLTTDLISRGYRGCRECCHLFSKSVVAQKLASRPAPNIRYTNIPELLQQYTRTLLNLQT